MVYNLRVTRDREKTLEFTGGEGPGPQPLGRIPLLIPPFLGKVVAGKGAAVALILGLVLLIVAYSQFYPGFDLGALLTLPSLLFLGLAVAGLLLLIGGAASLTSGLGPP